MGRTKDERFILCAYENMSGVGEEPCLLNRYEIGAKVGINPKGVDTICRLLAQANFIRFDGKEEFLLTDHGKKLVESLSQ